MLRQSGIVCGLLLIATIARGEGLIYPADAGVVDVTKAPYNAVGDGKTDCTAAIQKALDDHPSRNAIIFLPHGTYLISSTLKWPHGSRGGMEEKRTILQGQSRDGSILKLKDGVAADPQKPLAMIWTGKAPAQRFRNSVRSLTLDTGKNAAAIGAQFNASNQGTFRDMRIVGDGIIGLDFSFSDEIGPLYVRDVIVEGFAVGIKSTHAVNSLTLEHITLKNQREAGLINQGQCVSIRGLTSENAVPAVINGKNPSVMVLLDAKLHGINRKTTPAAISNQGLLLARNIDAPGHAIVIEHTGATPLDVKGPRVDEWVSHDVLGKAGGKTLNLPIKDAPTIPFDKTENWTGPHHFGGKPSQQNEKNDISDALQAAIDSGKRMLYFPNGQWMMDKDVVVRGNIDRIMGCEARVQGKGRLIIGDGAAPAVIIERIDGAYNGLKIHHASKRTLVLASSILSYTADEGAGNVFIEDVCGAPWHFKKQNVYARQINPENPETKIINDGGALWILGLKTERAGTLIDTRNGRTELLGGFTYTTARQPHDAPMFLVTDSDFSATIGEASFTRHPFKNLVRVTRKGEVVHELAIKQAPGRLFGSALPLYVAP